MEKATKAILRIVLAMGLIAVGASAVSAQGILPRPSKPAKPTKRGGKQSTPTRVTVQDVVELTDTTVAYGGLNERSIFYSGPEIIKSLGIMIDDSGNVYNENPGDYFEQDLGYLNNFHFKIDFCFYPDMQRFVSIDSSYNEKYDYANNVSLVATDYVLTLDSSHRRLAVRLNEDGEIQIVTNNGRERYNTGFYYVKNDWNRLILDYHEGDLFITHIQNGIEKSC